MSNNIFLRQAFGPSCPVGGSWYACTSGSRFVGCCKNNPCQLGCYDGNLEPASFDATFYGQVPDQECPSGSHWYTCTLTSPPFMGCCKSNPCSAGSCPDGDLAAAFLSSNPALAAPFIASNAASPTLGVSLSPDSSTSSATTSSTWLSDSSPSTTQVLSTSVPTTTFTSASDSTFKVATARPMPIGAIVGGTVGGLAVLAFLFGLIFIFLRRRAARKRPVGNIPLPMSRDSPYTDSSPFTPQPASYPFASPAPEKGYTIPPSYPVTENTKRTLSSPTAFSASPQSSPSLHNHQSMSSELDAGNHGMFHTAELDGLLSEVKILDMPEARKGREGTD